MKSTFRMSIALVVLMAGAALARAQGQPVLVLSVPSYNDLLADADFLGGLVGRPGSSQMADGMLKMMTQGKGLAGLDKAKPIEVVIAIDNGVFMPTICIPVTSAKDLADVVSSIQTGQPAQTVDGVIKLSEPPPAGDIYIREQSGWAFVTQSKDSPLPADPMTMLAGLSPDYDVAARAFVQNIPEDMKKSWIEKFKTFMQFAAQQHSGDDNPLSALSRKNMEAQTAQLEQLFEQADQITVGWKLDRAAKNTHFDMTFTAKPGSELDQEMQVMAKAKTNFAGFNKPDAAATFSICGINTQNKIDQTVTAIEQAKEKMDEAIDKDQNLQDDNARGKVKAALGKLIDVAEKTVKTGKMDGGGVVLLGADKLQVAVGGYVADGPGFESAIKDLIEMAKGEPDFNKAATVKLDLETYKEVKFQEVTLKLPEDADETAKKIFGDTVEVYVGVGPDSAYFAFGKDSLTLVKSVIDASAADPNKTVQPFKLSVALAPIFDFAAWATPDNPKAKMMAQAFDSVKGKDHVLVGAKLIPNGVTYRLDVEDGVLEAVGQASKAAMSMQRGPRGGAPGGNFGPAN
ncbi:MAG TPA: hypothetical protein VGI75_12180 [Pirellulales bacterium]